MKSEKNRIITSFSIAPALFQKLKDYKKENGISRSWLINKLLADYFQKVGGMKNGEQ